jgi:sarcosine oxidase
MFTNTPDNHFVIDLHPHYPQVSFASPCSGHGYKFASVIGEIMADLAQTGITRHDISLFRLDRVSGRLPGVPHSAVGSTQTEPDGYYDGRSQTFPRAKDVRPFW